MDRGRIGGAFACVLLLALMPRPAAGQDPPPDPVLPALDSVAAADTMGVSPRSAMIRSWLIPGWGQASVGAYARGGFFVAAQGAGWYMLLKSIARLAEAEAVEAARVSWVGDSLRAIIFADPDGAGAELRDPVAFQETLDEEPRVAAARALVESRRQQRQDWVAGTLFLTLISGVDAFVAAHLADAPVSLETAVTPDGAVRLGVRVPTGRRR